MLKERQVERVRELLRRNDPRVPKRQIARLTGVSRSSVQKIAAGKWIAPKKPDDETEINSGPIVKCGQCGASVHLPCQRCATLDQRNRPRRPKPDDFATDEAIPFDLKEKDAERLAIVRQERIAFDAPAFTAIDGPPPAEDFFNADPFEEGDPRE